MLVGKPLLPAHLIKHEFKIYVLVLFLSRFLVPLIIFQVANDFTVWLHRIAIMMYYSSPTDVWTPYPMLMNFYIYTLYAITQNDFVAFSLSFFLFNSLADMVNGVIIWKFLEKSENKYTHIMRWLYAYSPLTIIWVSHQLAFEPYIVMFMLMAIYLTGLKKISITSYLTSVAGSLKLFPLFAIFSLLISKDKFIERRKKFVFYCFVFLLFFNSVFFLNPSSYLSSFYWQLSRPAWGSIFSLMSVLLSENNFANNPFFNDITNNSLLFNLLKYGIIGITPDPVLLNKVVPLELSYLKIISLSMIISSIMIFLYFARKRDLNFEKILLGSLSLFFVFSFGFSPQYILYIFVLLFLVFKDKEFLLYIITFQIIALLEYPFSVILYVSNLISLNIEIIIFYSAVITRSALLIYFPIRLLRNENK